MPACALLTQYCNNILSTVPMGWPQSARLKGRAEKASVLDPLTPSLRRARDGELQYVATRIISSAPERYVITQGSYTPTVRN
jgi:hypothetical protein